MQINGMLGDLQRRYKLNNWTAYQLLRHTSFLAKHHPSKAPNGS
jgi:hypothetical protein